MNTRPVIVARPNPGGRRIPALAARRRNVSWRMAKPMVSGTAIHQSANSPMIPSPYQPSCAASETVVIAPRSSRGSDVSWRSWYMGPLAAGLSLAAKVNPFMAAPG
jgi:hypothetical protein